MTANLYAKFQKAFVAAGDKPALVNAAGDGPSFAALDRLSAQFAASLEDLGVGPGARVLAQVEKSLGAVALYLACLRLGAIFAPLNTAYTPGEVAAFAADAEPRLIVARQPMENPFGGSVVLGDGPASPLWAQALSCAPRNTATAVDGNAIAALVYTSGTTGRSKGAMLSHANLSSNAETLSDLWGFSSADTLLHALPIFHVHGLFVALHIAFLNTATTIFLPKFDAAEIVRLLPRASVMMGVPTFYTRLLGEAGLTRETAAGMRLFISGSAPLLAETHKAFAARTGHAILERYGMTEAGMITSNPLNGPRVPGTVGMALPGVDVRIVDEGGALCPPGAPGVIEIRGPNVFKGYWRAPEKTAAEFREDWFITGDVGVMAADGRVTIVGRAKDLIIAGGLNIYPVEIEAALDALPGVQESAVIGAPHKDLGEGVVAVVVLAPGARAGEAELLEALGAQLARFKLPRRIVFAAELPRNAMGKVQKALLREAHKAIFT